MHKFCDIVHIFTLDCGMDRSFSFFLDSLSIFIKSIYDAFIEVSSDQDMWKIKSSQNYILGTRLSLELLCTCKR